VAGKSGAKKKVAGKKGWLWGTIVHSQKYPMAKPICKSDRQHIYELHIIQGIQPKEIHALLFVGAQTRNFRHIQHICSKLRNDPLFRAKFLDGPHYHTGRPREINFGHRRHLADLACEAKAIKLEALRLQFAWDIFGVVDGRLKSRTTIWRNLIRMGLSLKVLKR